MDIVKGLSDRRRGQDKEGLLHVADPAIAASSPTASCRRRCGFSDQALTTVLGEVRARRVDGLAIAAMNKDGSVDYWVTGRALADPVRGSGIAARLLDLFNRLSPGGNSP